ncbi:MAG: hypothetical protein O7G86_13905, partial [Gammaproteobacteria bacterium]|nr:hypothetical protein [Gammaproteobacteria bacterium]
MICNACGNSNPSHNNFCIQCGTALKPVASRIEPDVIATEVSNLRLEVNALKESLQAHGIELVEPERPEYVASGPEPDPAPSISAEEAGHVGVERSAAAVSAGAEPARPGAEDYTEPAYQHASSSRGAGAAKAPPRASFFDRFDDFDWDAVIGGNWLVRVGALAVVLGMGFFLTLAFDNNWIGEVGRVALGLAF